VVRSCSKNGRRNIAQNSIEVDAKTKESTRNSEEELDLRNKEGHERKKPKRRPIGKIGSSGVQVSGNVEKRFETGDDDDDDILY
jgi:hypothetical protein